MKKGFACHEEEEAESEYFKEHLKGGKEELEAWQYVCVCAMRHFFDYYFVCLGQIA